MRRIARHISLLCSLLLSIGIGVTACENIDEQPSTTKHSIAYLHTLSRNYTVALGEDLYVEGYIVANDILNEVQNTIVVADDLAGVEIKIEGRELHLHLPLFAKVRIRCSGLALGHEGDCLVMGMPPTAEYVVDRIPSNNTLNHLSITSLDEHPPVTQCDIDCITSELFMRYVSLAGVRFIDEEQGATWCEHDTTTPHGYLTTIRHLTNGNDTLKVVTSGECDYASTTLPSGMLRCEGIIEQHDHEVALRIINYGITSL